MFSLNYIVWDFNPALLHIGDFEIRWYGLMWAIALLLGGYLFAYFCRRSNLSEKLSDDAFVYIVLGCILGSRIGHCLFYEPEYFLPRPWAIITEFRDGGMASHGATIGIILAIYLVARKHKISVFWILDKLGIIAPLSGAIIRIGNLCNSEIIGDPTTLPWGFKFVRLYPNVPLESIPACHPTQLYEAICYLIVFGVLWYMYKRTDLEQRKGLFFGVCLVGIFLGRFIIEFIKVEQEAFEKDMTLDMGQLLSVPFILIGMASIWYSLHHTFIREDLSEKVITAKTKKK